MAHTNNITQKTGLNPTEIDQAIAAYWVRLQKTEQKIARTNVNLTRLEVNPPAITAESNWLVRYHSACDEHVLLLGERRWLIDEIHFLTHGK